MRVHVNAVDAQIEAYVRVHVNAVAAQIEACARSGERTGVGTTLGRRGCQPWPARALSAADGLNSVYFTELVEPLPSA